MDETPIVDVHPSPLNPRKRFDDLDDLAASIRADGILQPLIVRPRPAGGHEIVAGERRYRAAKLAGVTPAGDACFWVGPDLCSACAGAVVVAGRTV